MKKVTIPVVVTLDDRGEFQHVKVAREPHFYIPRDAPVPRRFVEALVPAAKEAEFPATKNV